MRHRVTDTTLTDLLGLPGMVVTEYAIEKQEGREILHIFCEHENEVAMCPRCQQLSTKLHEREERCVRHLDIWGKRTFLHFANRRFDCERCGKPFTEQLPWIERSRRETEGYERHVYERCKREDQRRAATEERLHEATVAGIFKRWAKRERRNLSEPLVGVLGVDEIALKKRHKQYVLVLSDVERRYVVQVLSDRSRETLEGWLERLSSAQKQSIEAVSMDMWEPYRLAVRAKLPGAKIVADRFHVMKQLNERLTQLRRGTQREVAAQERGVLKGSRWLVVRNAAELTEQEQQQLGEIFEVCPELRIAYLLKERFRTICEKIHDCSRAERYLRAWMWEAESTGSKHLGKFVATLRNWWGEFLNYFDSRITNGFVEGMNHAIRNTIHRAYGFHEFANFALQVLAEHGQPGHSH